MNGTRKDNLDGLLPAPGEYGIDARGLWFGMTPNDHLANLSAHNVQEHEDGTITVTPSIKVSCPNRGELWHGYLQSGVWKSC